MDDNIEALTNRDVRGIIQRGGTILETSRCKPFRTAEGREKAAANLKARNVRGLIVIGGDGTFQGADLLSRGQGVPVVCVPGTIDNDIFGTDYTIGYDSAVNTALEAIDRIRDTAFSHERIFFVEVMGREPGSSRWRSESPAARRRSSLRRRPPTWKRSVGPFAVRSTAASAGSSWLWPRGMSWEEPSESPTR